MYRSSAELISEYQKIIWDHHFLPFQNGEFEQDFGKNDSPSKYIIGVIAFRRRVHFKRGLRSLYWEKAKIDDFYNRNIFNYLNVLLKALYNQVQSLDSKSWTDPDGHLHQSWGSRATEDGLLAEMDD